MSMQQSASKPRDATTLAVRLRDRLDAFRQAVAIDCGHIKVRPSRDTFMVGEESEPTPAGLQTLEIGLLLAEALEATGRHPLLNIVLSDASRLMTPSHRARLVDLIEQGFAPALLPASYRDRLAQVPHAQLRISLQKQHSNRAEKLMVRLKERLSKAALTAQGTIDAYGALFLRSLDDDLFALSAPLLFDDEAENAHFGARDWRDSSFVDRPEDLAAAPLTKVKRSGFIGLHEKSSGALCPATYAGYIWSHDNSVDHIAIHCRGDDAGIGEKVLRGVIAANLLSPSVNRNFLQITLASEGPLQEVSLLSSAQVRRRCSFDELERRMKNLALHERFIFGWARSRQGE
jgi:hypothetical protein